MYNYVMDLTSQRARIATSLLHLESCIARLVDALSHEDVTAQVDATGKVSAVRRICDAYSTIDYAMEDEANASLVCLGAVGVNADILKRALALNEAKAEFKLLCAPLHRVSVRIPVKDEPAPTRAISAMRVILRNIQRSDLNLLAAYRKIPILGAPPKSITYTRANTRAVYKKTVDEIAEMLAKLNSPAAIADRERLTNLDSRVTHLAWVKDRYPNIRANVLYQRLDPRGRGRIQISAELPLMYAQGRHPQIPEVNFPTDAAQQQRTRASKLESEPFLRSLPVYRYQ